MSCTTRTPLFLGMLSSIAGWVAAAEPEVGARGPRSPGVIHVKDWGATGDGVTRDTASIHRAIDAAADAGGGTVWFSPGRYLSGTLILRSGVTLHLESGATLLGSTDVGDYPPTIPKIRSYTDNYATQSLLYGEDLHDVAIMGRGTIDGQGGAFPLKAGAPYRDRPYILRLVSCRNVAIEGITLRDSPMWMQHYLNCERVRVRGITVFNHVNANNDMIDIDGCRDVFISDCRGDSDDDALTLKSTFDRPCENVTVTNCVLSSNCNALKMGTESNGGFKNITISNCTITPASNERVIYGSSGGLAGIALEIVDGGTLDGVAISNMAIRGVKAPMFMRLGNRARPFISGGPKPSVGTFRNVTVSNLIATEAQDIGCLLSGLPDHPLENVTLSDIRIEITGGGTPQMAARTIPEEADKYPECTMFGPLPAAGLYCRHVRGLTLRNIAIACTNPDARPLLACDDVHDLDASGLKGRDLARQSAAVMLKDVRGALLRGCIAPPGPESFLALHGACERISVIGNDMTARPVPFHLSAGVAAEVLYESGNRR